MKLIVCESYPGEISDAKAGDASRLLEKAIRVARETVALPDLPKDGEVVALRELSDLMAKRWEEHAKGMVKAVTAKVRGETI